MIYTVFIRGSVRISQHEDIHYTFDSLLSGTIPYLLRITQSNASQLGLLLFAISYPLADRLTESGGPSNVYGYYCYHYIGTWLAILGDIGCMAASLALKRHQSIAMKIYVLLVIWWIVTIGLQATYEAFLGFPSSL